MLQQTVLYIILAALASLGIVLLQYFYKVKNKEKEDYLMALLRFLSLFLLMLLIINPKILKKTLKEIKPNLVVAVDNSASIKNLHQENKVKDLVATIKTDQRLNAKFEIDFFSFGKKVSLLDSLNFKETQSNLNAPLKEFKALYKGKIAPIIYISDGNQTMGADYSYFKTEQTVYPIIVGDTIKKVDVKIQQLNTNTYAFLKNKFPVEILVKATTKTPVKSTLSIYEGNTKLVSKVVTFDKDNHSQILNFKLPATKVGKHFYSAKLSGVKNEQNSHNNTKRFSVDVIDEKAKIILLTSFMHPDIGALKRSIESNPQRALEVKNITQFNINQLSNYKLVILYQPTYDFKEIFNVLKNNKQHYFIITGSKTDWNFLNQVQPYFNKKALQKTENYLPVFNKDFDSFLLNNLDVSQYPPLIGAFGDITFSVANNSLLKQRISSFTTENPLLTTFEDGHFKGAALFGENIWKWRMATIKNNDTPLDFDMFIGKLIHYLSNTKNSNRLNTTSKSYYYTNESINITADYVDKNYTFNANATMWLHVFNKKSKFSKKYPFYIENGTYKVKVLNLPAGSYTYSVQVEGYSKKNTGSFKVIPLAVEQLYTSANKDKLEQLANISNGKVYNLSNAELLLNSLKQDNHNFKSIQKQSVKKTPLIDWYWLLGLLNFTLAIEWLLRKYFGKI